MGSPPDRARATVDDDEETPVNFMDSIRSVVSQYAGFSGRARRSECWYWLLFTALVSIVTDRVDAALGFDSLTGGPFSGVFSLAILVPTLAVGARRLHDTGRSGWWQLIGLVPIVGWIALVVLFVQDSHADNEHGRSPKPPIGSGPAPMPQPGDLYGSVPPPPPAQGQYTNPGQGMPPGAMPPMPPNQPPAPPQI